MRNDDVHFIRMMRMVMFI